MEKTLPGSNTKPNDPWPLMTEQDIDAAQQLIQLSSSDSSATCNSADLLDYTSTATKRGGFTGKCEIESRNNNNKASTSRVDSAADDMLCLSPVMKNNVRKRKFRAMDELYRVTRPIKLFQ